MSALEAPLCPLPIRPLSLLPFVCYYILSSPSLQLQVAYASGRQPFVEPLF